MQSIDQKKKFLATVLATAVLAVSLGMPGVYAVQDNPAPSASPTAPTAPQNPQTAEQEKQVGPTGPTGTTEQTGPEGTTGPTEQTGPQAPPGPTSPTGANAPASPEKEKPEYKWFWNGKAWEAEGYPWVWNGLEWQPVPSKLSATNPDGTSQPSTSATNSNTGPNSTNEASASTTNTATANQNNTAAINNTVGAALNTGNNTVAANTTAGNLTSGNIPVSVDLVNFINSVTSLGGGAVTMASIPTDYHGNIDMTRLDPRLLNAVLAYYVGSIFDLLARNSNTGPGSTNTATASATNNLDVNSNHNAAINNNIGISANTGNNTASYNTQVGNLTSGNIDVALNLINMINSILSVPVLDLAILNIFGSLFGNLYLDPALVGPSGSGGATAGNSTTGPNSVNTATATANNSLNLNTTNNANIGNNLAINANTGGNAMNMNTAAGNLTTGSVDVGVAINDIIRQITGDSWFLVFVNVLGKWTGQILGINGSNGSVVVLSGPQPSAANSNTGPLSTNTATATSENNTTVNAESNASIGNTINLDLNTGGNTVEGNTLAGNLTSGNIRVVGNILNIINQAITLNKRLFLGFINIMGDWVGNIMPRPAETTVASTGGTTSGTSTATSASATLSSPSSTPPAPSSNQGEGEGSGTFTVASGERSAVPRSSAKTSGSGQLTEGETVTLAGFQGAAPLPAQVAKATARALQVWKIISLALFLFGALLLTADFVSRRRKASHIQ